jgi:phage-related protein (TIGR01555 family)
MTRKRGNSVARAAKATSNKRWVAGDSFQNFEARVGVGTKNQTSGSGYGFDFISRNRIQLEAMYRSSWVVGAVTDVVADDMTRAGIEIESDLAPDKMDKIHAAFERMAIWDRINDTIKWSRLYGGALAVMMIDGQRPETPLNLNGIGPDQFKGLFVLDRWLVQPSLNDLVTDYGPDMGQPKFYDVVADSMALPRQRIHYSRVLRLDGVELPYWQKIAENLWGQSVIERLFDRLIAFDSTTAGAAQLVYKAHLRTLAVDGLRDVIGMGGPALEALLKNVDMIRRFQSNEGITLIDAKDTFETHQYSFSGLDNVLLQFGQQLSGATGIPLVRLFGQSPAGLNSTGDSDIRLYYDSTKQQQERKLRNPLTRLLEVVCRSEIGEAPPEGFQFGFNPLWQMSDTEKADVAQKTTTTVAMAFDDGLISQQTALKELRQSSHITGVWSNITDEMINDADDELPDLTELTAPDDPNARQEAGPEQESGPGAQS